MKSGISFIIPFYNAENRIAQTVSSLLSLNVTPNFNIEIIFVDNNSKDNSVRVIKKVISNFKNIQIKIKFIHEQMSGRIYALKKGIEYASHEIICHVDDDNHLQPDFASILWKYYISNPEIHACGALGLPKIDSDVELPMWFKDYKYSYAVGDPIGESRCLNPQIDWVYGACFSYRKNVFNTLENSGFQFILKGRSGKQLLSGEDMEFLLAILLLKFNVGFNQDLKFYHFIPKERITIDYLKKLSFGFGLASPFIGIYRSALIKKSFKSFVRSNYWIYILVQCITYLFEVVKSNNTLPKILKIEALKGSIISSFTNYDKWKKCQLNLEYLNKAVNV